MSLCAEKITFANKEFYQTVAPLQEKIQEAFRHKTEVISEMSELIEIINNAIADNGKENNKSDTQTNDKG